MALSPDGGELAIGYRSHLVRIFDVAKDGSLQPLRYMEDESAELHPSLGKGDSNFMTRMVAAHDTPAWGLAFLTGGRLLSAAGPGARREISGWGDVRLWDVENNRLLQTHMRKEGRNLTSIAVSPNEKFVAITCWGGETFVCELPLDQ